MVKKTDVFDVNERINEDIDYALIHDEFAKLRKFTWNWLKNALEESNIL